ncbi:MAG: hypothetical protein ACI8P3_000653 [Saprospiraceae bacterium]|jgi:hypothetical protein
MLTQKHRQGKLCQIKHLLLFSFLILNFLANAQYDGTPPIQWSLSVDIPKVSHDDDEDWALDVIETSEGNFLSVGFSEGTIFPAPSGVRLLPSWVMISAKGTVLADGIIDFGSDFRRGDFRNLVEGEDGFYFVGSKDDQDSPGRSAIILAKLNKSTLGLEFAKRIHIINGATPSIDSGNSIDIAKNAQGVEEIYIGGVSNSDALIAKFDKNGVYIQHKTYAGSFGGKDEIRDIKVVPIGSGNEIIFTGSEQIADNSFSSNGLFNADGLMTQGVTVQKLDTDIIVGRLYSNFNLAWLKKFNSVVDPANPNPSLFSLFPREFTAEYGPCTPGKTMLNNTPGCIQQPDPGANCCESPVIDDNFEFNSRDIGRKILLSKNGDILVGCWANTLFMWRGLQSHWSLQNNENAPNQPHFMISDDCGNHYHDYLDGEGYLLRLTSGGTLANAKHTGHLSGGDFNTPIAEDDDGNIYFGGTTSDKGFADPPSNPMPDVTSLFSNFLVKLNPGFDVIWRYHFVGQGEGNCLFGMTLTNDGGILVCGNTEIELPGDEEIEAYSFVKLAPNCASDIVYDGPDDINEPDHTYIIGSNPGDDYWSTDRKVNSLVIVPAGKTLNIDGTGTQGGINIEFANSRLTFGIGEIKPIGISVEKGGVLRIKGATLKGINACGGEQMWDGIMVKGTPFQSPIYFYQGRAYISEDSKIENAVVAVLLDEFKYETNTETVESEWDYINGVPLTTGYSINSSKFDTHNHQGGAFLYARDSEFLNNREGIVMHYRTKTSLNRVENCNLICDQPMLDLNSFCEEEISGGRPLGTRAHVVMENIQNVNFVGNSFTGNPNLDADIRGTGIESIASRYSVVGTNAQSNPTEFKDLTIGIETLSYISTPVGNNVDLKNNNFDKVIQGLNLRNSTGAEITKNNFTNIDPTGWGIFCAQSNAFSIAFNNFIGIYPGGRFGLIVDQSAGNGGEVKENTFEDLFVGSQFQNNNAALLAPCNTYDDIKSISWRVLEKTTGAGALAAQGQPGQGEEKADNRFKDACSGSNPGEETTDIYSQIVFSYYDKAGNMYPADGDCVDINVDFNYDQSDPSIDHCAGLMTEDCPEPPCFTEVWTAYNNSPKEIADRNRVMRYFLHWDTYEIPDSVNLIELDTIINLLAGRTEEADKRLLLTTYLAEQDYSKANTAMSFVSGSDPESIDFMAYHDLLIQAGLAGDPWYDLPQSTLDDLLTYKTANTSVAENANMLDYYYNGIYTPLVPLELPPAQFFAPENGGDIPEQAERAKVYPNPFNKEVIFELANDKPATILITDLLGRILWHYEIQKGEQTITWTPENLNPGTYLYRIQTSEGQNEQGKLLFIK